MTKPTVGVLALQGDVREHLAALTACGATAVPVRRPEEIEHLDGIVLPGGESTTIDKLSRIFGVREPLIAALQNGLPAYGSCAGMILLAEEVLDGTADQQTFGGLAITVRRNAFGRQVESFETDVELDGLPDGPVHAVFIRAPWVERIHDGVRVLGAVTPPGTDEAHIIAVQQGNLLATSFHPEVTSRPAHPPLLPGSGPRRLTRNVRTTGRQTTADQLCGRNGGQAFGWSSVGFGSSSGGTTGASGSDGATGSGAGSGVGSVDVVSDCRCSHGGPSLPQTVSSAVGRPVPDPPAPASVFGTGAYAGGGVADWEPENGPGYVDAPVTGGGAAGTVVPSGTMNNAMM